MGESYFRISNHDQIAPFFMSIVSDSDHWMFISSNGGLTAGRKNSDYSLFPYYTDDKLTELSESTGSKSIFRVAVQGKELTWEPFSIRQDGRYKVSRSLYKNLFGNKLVFEEVNHDLKLTFRYQWRSSDKFGWVRTSYLLNDSDEVVQLSFVDGIQNMMPYGVSEGLQGIRSNLVDAYKRSELDTESGLGIFALSAIIVDRAEPSEALKANVAWSVGLDESTHLLSSDQLEAFRNGKNLSQEEDVKARKGAYLLHNKLQVESGKEKSWSIIADVNQGPSDVTALIATLRAKRSTLQNEIEADIDKGTENLRHLVSASDGFQVTADAKVNARHYSNTLFNIMRGGIFDDNYTIEKADFIQYLRKANKNVSDAVDGLVEQLPKSFSYQELRRQVTASENADFKRLGIEYLPLKFSRRHGDPSRPWNRFSINTRSEVDGSKILDYEGNWRDIFQNWEALAHSYPCYIEGMIFKFLNASTFDGYNPYRVTKDGFDWEVIEEHDPWSYIGYWGDHQIIYLLKFLEFAQDYFPGKLASYFTQDLFVYANVPYKIKSYEESLANPKDTILFDYELDHTVRAKRDEIGADGALICDQANRIHRVNFIEKLLVTALTKLSNFIPEAGIWLNTQRPEWNDANNALVGNGVSMVTLYYLRRFFTFLKEILAESKDTEFGLSEEILVFFHGIKSTLTTHVLSLAGSIDDTTRRTILNGLGQAGSNYRSSIYDRNFSGKKSSLEATELSGFVDLVLKYLEHSIRANKREDNMYHAYNIMTVENDAEISISYLDVMLEGQVAVLSSQYLSGKESLEVLDAMKNSELFRSDQYSYLLYPAKELPKFLVKNTIPSASVAGSGLLKQLVEDGNKSIIEQDVTGNYHFNGSFNNADVLAEALDHLPEKYCSMVDKGKDQVQSIYEEVFNHKAFTGRSGTFYGYEGLGSIYWHMVSKLLLAVEESCLLSISAGDSDEVSGQLMEHFYEIHAGIGVDKSPELYGAFPIDPYSHTPTGKGAQQPGMTGQVKEDILSRIGELGVSIKNGCIHFNPRLLRASEFLTSEAELVYSDVNHEHKSLKVESDQLAFLCCQVPVIYTKNNKDGIVISYSTGKTAYTSRHSLDVTTSQQLFERTGEIEKIHVNISSTDLK